MKLSKTLAWVAALGTVGLTQAASADDIGGAVVRTGATDCGDTVTAEILTILREAGNIDSGQYEALCRKAQGESAPPPAQAESGEPTWKFKWSNGFQLSRSDEAFKLKFGGRMMLDGAYIGLDSDLAGDFRDAGIDPMEGDGVEFRRARIFFSGTVYERLFFKAQYDFAQSSGDDPAFKDVYMGVKLGPVKDLRVGHFKEPMMLEEWTSSKYITFMERGLNNVFFPGRNVGLMAGGDAVDKRLFWQTGIFRDTNDQGFAFDGGADTQWDVAARLAGVPLYTDEGNTLIHLGGSYIHRFLDTDPDGNLRFRQRPEAHLAQRFVDTQGIVASDADIFNLEAAGVFGPFSVQSEFTNALLEGDGSQQDVWFWGVYAYASWFLTGEHRAYDLGNGRFARLKPKKNFNPSNGGWGAWELAARYSYLDLNDRNIRGGKLWDVTAGLNWYLSPNLRWMLNYVHGHVGDRTYDGESIRGAGDIVQTRFQVDF